MQKSSHQKTKLFEFATLFTMVVGTVVGTGIYMKNNELLRQTQNPIVALILWVIVGIVCVLSVAVFIEISSSTKHIGNGTIGNWTKLFINRKVASFFSLIYLIVYVPSTQAFFVGSFIMYLFNAIGLDINPSTQIFIYLIAGLSLLASFTVLHIFAPKYGKGLQIFGTIFKFIPLIIALIAGFILIDKSIDGSSAMWNGGYNGNEWDTSQFKPTAFFGGFGAILFSFDGYIYIANAQRDATHKEVVPKALFFGMIFVASFYFLMALSLFLGSPDGSIVRLFEKIFTGGKESVSPSIVSASRILSNIILMIICILNVNVFTYIGAVGVESDAEAGLLYPGINKTTMTPKFAAWLQVGVVGIIYSVLLILGFLIPFGSWNGMSTVIDFNNNPDIYYAPLTLLGDFSSAISALTFLLIAIVIFAGIVNRKTNKVQVDKVKGFLPIAWFSGIMMVIFTFFGIFSFVVPNDVLKGGSWIKSEGFTFTLMLFISLIACVIGYFVQEKMFIKAKKFQNNKMTLTESK